VANPSPKDDDFVSIVRGRRTRDPVEVIALAEPVVAESVLALLGRSERALVDGGTIVIDLRDLHRIDTQTLSELCAALHKVNPQGAKLAVVGADPRVQWVLALCDIDGLELHSGRWRGGA
jgi:anti-anti-sigma regulatory factor